MELLQNKLRPNSLKDVIGQKHLIGKDKILTNLIKNKKVFNMIFYGPTGSGKTTIALAIVNDLNMRHRILNATINSKKDFEIVIEEAKMYNEMILIVDEIHRMNKDKQDLLLSYIESGLITLIGITSANPYHSINKAIRSRCQLLRLVELDKSDVVGAIKKIPKYLENLALDKKTINFIADISNGDLRYAYNLIEFCYYSFGGNFTISQIKETSNINYSNDKNEDGLYDLLSAFHKSIRGSDADAALHYLSRLILSGDFDAIHRRMLAIAYEDIGLSNPMLPVRVLTAVEVSERLGMPECILPLSNAVIEMANSPKSNSAYIAISAAINDVKVNNFSKVPNHIKTTSPNYKYPHDYKNYYVKQQYMPDKLIGRTYYKPKNNRIELETYKYISNIKKDEK